MRNWEESCLAEETKKIEKGENDELLIKQALLSKNNWQESDGVKIKISTNDGEFAGGSVTAQDGGGYFFAAKVNGVWKIVADGNGVILCSALKDYPHFPKTLIPECWDETANKNIKR